MSEPAPPHGTARLPALPSAKIPPPAEVDLSRGPTPVLVLIHPPGAGLGARFPLGSNEITVGRGPACEMSVAEMSVSRSHATLAPLPDGRYKVTDLGSANGTFVNDVRVTTGELGDGDLLRVGMLVFKFVGPAGG